MVFGWANDITSEYTARILTNMNVVSLQDLSTFDPAAAANANLAVHASWAQRRTPGMRVIKTNDLVLVDSGLPCDTFNFVCRSRLAQDTARERIRATIDHFAAAGRPFSWWLNPGDQPLELGEFLLDAGLQRAETELAMAADLGKLRHSEHSPDGLQIRRVRTAAQLRDFANILAANWAPPNSEVLRFYELTASALLANDSALWQYVGYLGEAPVATAELTMGGGVVGLYNVCTQVDYRRRGFGTALTLIPLLDARAHGYLTAVLQASTDGASVYTRVGFQAFGQVTEYKPTKPDGIVP